MNRDQIEKMYQWDLDVMYDCQEVIDKDFELAESKLLELEAHSQVLIDSKENLVQFYRSYEETSILIEKLYEYGHLNCDVVPENQGMQEHFAKSKIYITKLNQIMKAAEIQLLNSSETVKTYREDSELIDFHHSLDDVLRKLPHTASDEIEQFIAKIDPILNNGAQTYTMFRPEFKPVNIDGKEHFLNQSTLMQFLKNEDEQVRLEAYENFYGEYKKFENVFASTLSGNTKKNCMKADVHKFKDALEASLFLDNAPRSLFDKILYVSNDKYHHLFHRYNELKRKALGFDKLRNYDLSIPLVKNVDLKFTVEESFDLIKEAVTPFGEEYISVLNKAKDERWVDFYTHKGKRAGAYSSGSYATNPNILMNYIGDYSSMSTLAHELGHSVHTYFSNTHQRYINANYTIFVAEVASTVNETLLFNLMIKKAKSQEEKAYLIYNFLEKCVGLIYRQPMFAAFEHGIHVKEEKGEPLSSKFITELYEELNKAYFGDDIELHPLTKYSCYAIPHFYYNYYVYKYTLGMCVALAVVSRILEGDQQQVENYLNFLKSGGSKYPIDLLKSAGVDPTEDGLYEDAFKFFEEKLKELEEIL